MAVSPRSCVSGWAVARACPPRSVHPRPHLGGRLRERGCEEAGPRRHRRRDPARSIDVFTEEQVDTKLARGYEDAVAGDLNEWWFWLPLCLLFVAPFFDFRRPLRLLHLDLLVLLGFSASLFFFNKGDIDLGPRCSSIRSWPTSSPACCSMGFRPSESRERLLPHARRAWLVAGIAALVGLYGWFTVSEAKVIDVGVAGVIGADRLTDGDDIYGDDFSEGLPESGDVRGDVYGPVNYLAYVPAEQAFP